MSIPLVDFHCHLDLYSDFVTLIEESEHNKIHTLAVTTTPMAWPRNRDLAGTTKHVKAALGLHPQLVSERDHEIELWKKYLPEARYVGEVGLDAGPRFYHSLDLQKKVFREILTECSLLGRKVLTIHSLRTASTVLDFLEEYLDLGTCKVVLHWFTGSRKDAERALDLGCYFSINAEMTTKERHQTLLKGIPANRILSETDGPFTQCNGRLTRPRDVCHVINSLSKILDQPAEIVARIIRQNLNELTSEII